MHNTRKSSDDKDAVMAAGESEEVDETTRRKYGDVIDISIGCLEQYCQDKKKFKSAYHDHMGKAK